jgi:hypothetical protein
MPLWMSLLVNQQEVVNFNLRTLNSTLEALGITVSANKSSEGANPIAKF